MSILQIRALATKDLRIFSSDRRAMLITFAVPIAIASFIGSMMGGGNSNAPMKKIDVLVVDQDSSQLSKKLVADLEATPVVKTLEGSETAALAAVGKGDASAAIVIPKGFGVQAVQAFMGGSQPQLLLDFDPSRALEMQAVRGTVMQVFMQDLGNAAFGGGGPGGGKMSAPFELQVRPVTANSDAQAWSGAAHMFGGMAVQGVLFYGIDAAMGLLRDRRLGIWKRLRAAPTSLLSILLAKILSSSLIATFILLGILLFGMVVFHIRVLGSLMGLAGIVVSAAIMTAAFGLLVASLGRTEGQSRGLSTLAVLSMTMLGGAWFPAEMMPDLFQKISVITPVHWAVMGFDSMFWRGEGLSAAMAPILGLLTFAVAFGAIAVYRFKSMPETGLT